MATKRNWHCTKCGSDVPTTQSLFDALFHCAEDRAPRCDKCEEPYRLMLEPAFGLNAGTRPFTVLDCFLPNPLPDTWSDENRAPVQFYPFLVILEKNDERKGRAAWLPYWHLVGEPGKQTRKYGQWAPFMDIDLYKSLLAQAKQKGHLKV